MKKSRGRTENKNKIDKNNLWSHEDKNAFKMRLLILLPAFQREVASAREKFEIPLDGFSSDDDAYIYSKYKDLFTDIWNLPSAWDHEKPSEFASIINKIGDKFKLPYNFYNDPLSGIPYYIIRGIIRVPPKNWEIDFDYRDTPRNKPNDKNPNLKWIAVRAYSPLSEHEIGEASKILRDFEHPQTYRMDILNIRRRENSERDLRIAEQLANRKANPKKYKKYKTGSYLDSLKKTGADPETLRREERRPGRKGYITIEYSEPTAQQIAVKEKVSAPVVRAALKRLNETAKQLFGHKLSEL